MTQSNRLHPFHDKSRKATGPEGRETVERRAWRFFLALALLLPILLLLNFTQIILAGVATPIAIAVENSSFDTSNTGGDAESTLLWMRGDATLNTLPGTAGALDLTSTGWQAGSVVKRNQVRLTDGFSTYFQIYFSGAADGIAFVLYDADEPQLGDNGGALGYGDKDLAMPVSYVGDGEDHQIHDSIIVEFDSWTNYSTTDEKYDDSGSGDHVAVMLDGNQVHSTQSSQAILKNYSLSGKTIHAWVDYKVATETTPATITVRFGTSSTRSDSSNKEITRTLLATDNAPGAGDDVFVGFTSSTGGNSTRHALQKWYFKDTYLSGGLSSVTNAYTQAPGMVTVSVDKETDPASASIIVKSSSGSVMTGQNFTLYIDDVSQGVFNSGVTGTYTYTNFATLSPGDHTIRAVAVGGVSNFADFTMLDHQAPTLASGDVDRSSNAAATVQFSSDEGGTYYYAYTNHGNLPPPIDITGSGSAMQNGTNTITIASLTAGSKDIYVVAKDAAGNVSNTIQMLIPEFVPPTYTITFDTDGGSPVTAITQTEGNGVTAPSDPTKTGYTFAGWSPALPKTMPAADTTVTAQWTVNEYTITFDTDGGSPVTAITQDYDTSVTAPYDPTKTGYTFAGWSPALPKTMPAADTTVTAQWTVNEYEIRITYVMSDGSTAPGQISELVTYGSLYTKASPAVAGYTPDVATVSGTMGASSRLVTVTYTPNTDTVYRVEHYQKNLDGSMRLVDELLYTGTTNTEVTATLRTYIGFITPSVAPSGVIRGDGTLILTVTYERNSYTLSFDTKGGTPVVAITGLYESTVPGVTAPTREGYIFAGWSPVIPATMPAENLQILATWQVDKVYTLKALVASLPLPGTSDADDDATIKAVRTYYDQLTVDEKAQIPLETLDKLLRLGTESANRLLKDPISGVSVRTSGNTMLNPNLLLSIEVIRETQEQKNGLAVVGPNNQIVKLFDISLLLDGKKVQPDGKITITLPLTEAMKTSFREFRIVFIDDTNKVTVIPCTVNADTITFETDHLSSYGIIGTTITDTSVAKTGETESILWILALVAAAISLITIFALRRRRSTHK